MVKFVGKIFCTERNVDMTPYAELNIAELKALKEELLTR